MKNIEFLSLKIVLCKKNSTDPGKIPHIPHFILVFMFLTNVQFVHVFKRVSRLDGEEGASCFTFLSSWGLVIVMRLSLMSDQSHLLFSKDRV